MVAFFESAFTAIGEFFTKVWDILVFIWDELTTFFRMIAPAIKFFTDMLQNLPSLFFYFGLAMLIVLVVYVIIGRTAGGD